MFLMLVLGLDFEKLHGRSLDSLVLSLCSCAGGLGGSGSFRRSRRNADPCVRSGCKWPRSSDGRVSVPYQLDTPEAQAFIQSSMETFARSTCVQFIPRTFESDYLHIRNLQHCRSFVGRRGGAQTLELSFPNCFTIGIIQHELLHALGFHHEQSRSDRDRYITVNWDNIDTLENRENFYKVNTVNLRTRYDYNSIMHYPRSPVLEAKPYWREFGTATVMSNTDLIRVHRLYCSNWNWL
uniref:Metalloendopeptidase n=1 Tax=Periophthalmus magnuspinnatus TaxID=409849 RepID=A0A3B4AVI0_9GOBI